MEKGADGFSEKYWKENYSNAAEMDCIGNVKEHTSYLKSFFDLEMVSISSVIDFGFGQGHLFKKIMKEFIPYKAYGIEPSVSVFEKASIEKWKPVASTKLELKNIDLVTWAKAQTSKSKFYDLGVCTSVFQYLTEDELKSVLPVMAKKVKYLYLTVPTKKELERQVDDLDFFDRYAKRRGQKFYLRNISPYFTFISSRILESKVHFNEDSTLFTDLMFRF